MSSENPWASPGQRPGRPTPPSAAPNAAPQPPQHPNLAPGTPQPADPSAQPGAAPPEQVSANADGWYAQPHYGSGWQGPASTVPPRRGPEATRIALWVIGALVAIAVVVAAVAAWRYHRETEPLGEVTGAQSVHVPRVSAGTCVESLPRDGSLTSVRVVPCDSDHQAEVISTLPLNERDWPGRDRVAAEVESLCDLTSTQQDLGLAVTTWVPTEQGWDRGDRRGVCLVYHPTGSVVGSFVAGDEVEATS